MKKTDENVLSYMRNDAYYAYLELCNATCKVPEKLVYEAIREEAIGENLDWITSIIESQHGEYEREMDKMKTPQPPLTFLQKLKKFFS